MSLLVQAQLRQFKAEIFQALAHPTRVAIVEILREGEMGTGDIVDKLSLEQANVSQHLAILRTKSIVTARKSGNQVFYSLRDPVLTQVLDILRQYFYSQLSETKNMWDEMKLERVRRR